MKSPSLATFRSLILLLSSLALLFSGDLLAYGWQDLSGNFTIQAQDPLRNRLDPDAELRLSLEYRGSDILEGDLRLILRGLAPEGITIDGASQNPDTGETYLDLPPWFGGTVQPGESAQPISLLIGNGGPNNFTFTPVIEFWDGPPPMPTLVITQPASLSTVGATPITITGTVSDTAAALTLNGKPIANDQGVFQADVQLEEGSNAIILRAVDANNQEAVATVNVALDSTPPYVTIQSPEDGTTVYTESIAVSGLVNDIVRGNVSENDALVRVNGVTASVSNRAYLAEDVTLQEGENIIEVFATDAVGNLGVAAATITYQPQIERIIEVASGQSQEGEIYQSLGEPLVVKLTENGKPVVDKPVIFRVVQGDGMVEEVLEGRQPGTHEEDRATLSHTDANGLARALFKLGSRAGEATHQVRATSVGFDGEVIFHAKANYAQGDKLGVIAGANQRGSIWQPLPDPLVVAVTDRGANLIPNAQVQFEIIEGGGTFDNGQTTFTTASDKDGRANARWTLGGKQGLDVQRVTAKLVGTSASAGFTASGFKPADPGQTAISGVVLNNQDIPLPGVTVRVDDDEHPREAVTNDQGQFTITEVPVGPVHIVAEGATTSVPGEWPSIAYNLVTVPGVNNPLPAPIYLVELDMDNAVWVGAEDKELTLPEVPGFKLKVKKDSVTFPDGAKEGLLSITPVNANKIPMPPPNGMQPQFIVTIQPHGAKFDPPAELTLPNVDGHAPGAEVEMYSYDHDLEEFVTIGLGTISNDGSLIVSNPGVGVVKAGWHCGSQASPQGCCSGGKGVGGCPMCQKSKTNDCSSSDCVDDDSQDPGVCMVCSGGEIVPDDFEIPVGTNSRCEMCLLGEVVPAKTKDGSACSDAADEQCFTCSNGACGNHCNPSSRTLSVSWTKDDPFEKLNKLTEVLKKVPWLKGDLKAEGTIGAINGEECCNDCSIPSPVEYTKVEVKGGLAGDLEVFIPGWGGDFDPIRLWPIYRVSGEYLFGPFGRFTPDLELAGGYKDTDCNDPACVAINGVGGFGFAGGLTGGAEVSLDTLQSDVSGCSFFSKYDDRCWEKWFGVGGKVEGRIETGIDATFKTYLGGDSCPSSSCSYGVRDVKGTFEVSVNIKTPFFDYAIKFEEDAMLVEGKPRSPCW